MDNPDKMTESPIKNYEYRHDTMRKHMRPLSEQQVYEVNTIKEKGQELYDWLDMLPASRELSLAKTKIEEAVMWAVKGVTS